MATASTKALMPFVRSAYNYDRDAASLESGLRCPLSEKMTKDSFLEETDINVIVKRFGLTGELPRGVRMPSYGDFTGVYDFHSAMNAVAEARESFDAMPAHVRARFDNDPAKFVDFCSKDENYDEARKMGLVSPRVAATDPMDTGTAQLPIPGQDRAQKPLDAPKAPPVEGDKGGKTS